MHQLQLPIKQVRPGTKAYLVEKKLVFGGALNYRKKKRPFRKNRAVHVIFRSQSLGGTRTLNRQTRKSFIESLLRKKSFRYGARLFRFSINSNHIHVLIRFGSRRAQANFLRDFAGSLALWIRRQFLLKKKIWDARPFTSVVGAKAFLKIVAYIEKNRKESSGAWAYERRPVSAMERILARIEGTSTLGALVLAPPSQAPP